MKSNYGISKIENLYKNKVVPKTIQILMKVYGISADIYRVKNKKKINQSRTEVQASNKFSREVYQNNSLLTNSIDSLSVIDDNTSDYINNLDKIHSTYILLTNIGFEQFSGFISGVDEDVNVYCLDFDLKQNDVLEIITKEGIKSRFKIKEINSIGKSMVVLKRYTAVSLIF